jgi:hypothetical protein
MVEKGHLFKDLLDKKRFDTTNLLDLFGELQIQEK